MGNEEEGMEVGAPVRVPVSAKRGGVNRATHLARRMRAVELRSQGWSPYEIEVELKLEPGKASELIRTELRERAKGYAAEVDTLKARELVSLDRWQRRVEALMESKASDRLVVALLRIQERKLALSGVSVAPGEERVGDGPLWANLTPSRVSPQGLAPAPDVGPVAHLSPFMQRMLVEAGSLGAMVGAASAVAAQAAVLPPPAPFVPVVAQLVPESPARPPEEGRLAPVIDLTAELVAPRLGQDR